ncbi:MAG: hypothetical protein GXO46_00460 [Chlorobi bacterium]|nr:hypothetical protein [Chlorobiota bacterium]
MVYITVITSMLFLIYKKANNLGYKIAKTRIAMVLIIFAGRNPDKVFKT